MYPSRAAVLRPCALFVVLLPSAFTCTAQFSRLDDLASQIAKEVKPLKPHLVAVADFRSLDGKTSVQGHYFAWMVTDALRERSKKKFTVAGHKEFDDDLTKLKLSASTLVPGESLRSVAPHIGADILILGTIERRGSSYFLELTPVHTADGQTLATTCKSIVVNDFLDSMFTPFPENMLKAGAQGVSLPGCIHCPDPSYTDLARREKSPDIQ